MDILSNFSETLFCLLLDNKVTSEEFADTVKIDISVVYRYLRKKNIPTLSNAITIAEYFNCSLDFLFALKPEDNIKNYKKPCPFSIRFIEILESRHLSRYRLCKETKISSQRVDDWYHGKRLPTIESCIRLAEFFDCTLDYLIGRE